MIAQLVGIITVAVIWFFLGFEFGRYWEKDKKK